MIDNYEKVTLDNDIPLKIIRLNPDVMEAQMGYRLPSGVEYFIPPHWHRSVELSFILKGSLNLRVGDSLEQKDAGDVLFVNSGVVHEVGSVVQDDFDMVVLLISYDFMKMSFSNFDNLSFSVTESNQDQLAQKIFEIAQLFGDGHTYDPFMIKAKLNEIMSVLNNDGKTIKENQSKDYDLAKRILSFVHENYSTGITQQDAASHFGLSREYFSRLFKKTFGFSFMQYLINYRLFRAYPDIVLTKDSMIDIAIEHGFPDSRSLIKHFKEKYHQTPGEYRKENRGSIQGFTDTGLDNIITLKPR